MPKLFIKKPQGGTAEIKLSGAQYSIGRAADNEVVLEDSGVSRHHGVIERKGEHFVIRDRESHNGTYVNGRRVESAALRDKDQIQVGQHILVYLERESALFTPDPITVSFEADYDQMLSQATAEVGGGELTEADSTLMWQLHKEQRTLRLLFELSNALSNLHSVEDVSAEAIEILLQTTKAERGAIFLLKGEHGALTPVMVKSRGASNARYEPVVLSSTISSRILTERKGIITADATADDRFAHGQSVAVHGLRSIACAPLLGKEGNLGILYLENKTAVGAFSQDDLRLLCAVAAQIALAIENARFFDALKRSNEELEQIVEERTAALQRTQLKLYQTEKMASLSRLVAGVAHEINSPLGALKSNLELLMVMFGRAATTPGRPKEEAVLFEHLVGLGQASVGACARIVNVVRALSSFARLDEAEFKQADINEGVRTVVRLLDPALSRDVRIALDLGDIPEIQCYPALLNEAFMNLLVNACQAIKKSGEVTIQTRRDGEHVRIRIQDTGTGIAPEHLDKIFDPGFTTKRVGVGVGLGLAVVYSVIKEHEGSIDVESELNRGSTFTIRLPVSRAAPKAGD
jgi:signal transduction histidine kinase